MLGVTSFLSQIEIEVSFWSIGEIGFRNKWMEGEFWSKIWAYYSHDQNLANLGKTKNHKPTDISWFCLCAISFDVIKINQIF